MLALWSMITGRLPLRDSVTGPIGLVYLTSEAVKMGIAPLLFLTSLFSLSLAIFNVFPIPILDGGHLLFLALEKLRGRPVSVSQGERSFAGIARGVDADGALLVELDGVRRRFHSGEVSVRAVG